MNKNIFNKGLIFIAITLLVACNPGKSNKMINQLEEEIMSTENEFAESVKRNGIAEGFYEFADENAVIKRQNDTLIKGKENIRLFYQKPSYKNAMVSWKPDFVEVSEDGSLGYTFGNYTWIVKDSTGKTDEYKGVFHTVWKRQSNGSWKYVWD